jgi:glutamine amidotransferase PdxT
MKEAIIIAQSEKNKSEAIIAALGDGIIIQDTGLYNHLSEQAPDRDIWGTCRGALLQSV